jgi:hypothetical protein
LNFLVKSTISRFHSRSSVGLPTSQNIIPPRRANKKPRRLPDDVREEVLKQFDESLQIYHFPEVLKQIGHNSSTYPDIEI